MFFEGSKKGTLPFEEAHGVGGLSEIGRPRPPPRILAENLADTTARWFGRPSRPAGPPPSLTTVSFR